MKAALRQHLKSQWYRCRLRAQRKALPKAIGPIRITCAGKRDGGGAQWHACISVWALARAYGLAYIHTPFSIIEHGRADDANWLQAWNTLFNLESCGISTQASASNHQVFTDPLNLLIHLRQRRCCSDAVLTLEHAHPFTNQFPVTLTELQPLLRQAYRPRNNLAPPPVQLHQTVVVHVRRGDVQPTGPHRQRFTSAEALALQCRCLLAQRPQLRQVLLLSASPDADLLALQQSGFILDYSHDVFTHLHWMTQAAALIMAKSSLSYLAALLNPNLVVYEPFEHPPLQGWFMAAKLKQ